MKTEEKNITPAEAMAILKVQEERIAKGEFNQRKLDERTINKYANTMANGQWIVNNQGIGFDSNGNLVDGRHRLWAVVRCGKTVPFLVVQGMEDIKNNGLTIRAIDTIDCGRPRLVGQQLDIDGFRYGNLLGACCNVVNMVFTQNSERRLTVITAKSILGIYGENWSKCMEIMSHKSKQMKGYIIGPVGIFMDVFPGKAKAFLQDYVGMEGLAKGSPIIALRRYMESYTRRHTIINVQVVCSALRHYSEGNSIEFLRPSSDHLIWLARISKKSDAIMKIIGYNVEPTATKKKKE